MRNVPAVRLVVALLAFAFMPAASLAQTPTVRMSGVSAANAFWSELASDPAGQTAILARYTPALTIDTLLLPASAVERLSLGEAMFLSFEPPEARAYFASVSEGDDLVALHARDRLMQIRYRAFSDSVGMRDLFDEHYSKFPPSVMAVRGRFQQVYNMASDAESDGRSDDVVTLILDELESLPGDAPYRSFDLPGLFTSLIHESSRAPEVVSVVDVVLGQLRGTLHRWSREDPPARHDPQLQNLMPAWFWRAEGVRPGETFHEARLRQLRALVIDLDGWVRETRTAIGVGESESG